MVSPADILNARILVVDDQEANVRLLEGMLRIAGYASIMSTMDAKCGALSPDIGSVLSGRPDPPEGTNIPEAESEAAVRSWAALTIRGCRAQLPSGP
jgi:CheY-like chemotaxis protein